MFNRLLSFLLLGSAVQSRIFDSIVGYRVGSNGVNTDTAKYPHEWEEPDAPDSVDDLFGYTATEQSDGTIDIVHCYSMRNGLYGRQTEARVLWTKLDPETYQDQYRQGSGQQIQARSFPIDSILKQFAVHEEDQTAFIMTQSLKSLRLTLWLVPGPTVSERPMRTFIFKKFDTIDFTVSQLLILPEVQKAVIYGTEFYAEISLENYPFDGEPDSYEYPQIQVHRYQGNKLDKGSRPDKSDKSQIIQAEPVYVDGVWQDQLYLLSTDIANFKISLRIDVVSASNPLGTAQNIARINTEAVAAWQNAKFAEIAVLNQGSSRRHIFATTSYQSSPSEVNFLTISEVTFENGVWSNDRSQAFVLPMNSLEETYLTVLAIRKKHDVELQEGRVEFTIFLSGASKLFKIDMCIDQDAQTKDWSIIKADMHKSVNLKIEQSISKVFYQPDHLVKTNARWPDFYMFMSTTRANVSPIVSKSNDPGQILVKDGLIMSEYHFRDYEPIKLFKETQDISELFVSSAIGGLEGLVYTDSSILTPNDPTQQAWNRTTVFSEFMSSDNTVELTMNEPGYGTEWIDNFELCKSDGIDYKTMGTTGMSYRQIVSYMDTEQSTKANVLSNELTIAEEGYKDVYKIYNNLDKLMDEVYFDSCREDAICGATFTLCYNKERSTIRECDKDMKATDTEWRPKESQVIPDLGLIGDAWKFEVTTDDMPCYFASLEVERIDGKKALLQHSLLTKRIFVADPGEDPFLDKEKKKDLYAQAGESRIISFSNITDPEGRELIFNANLKKASSFARWDPELLAIVIEADSTSMEKHAGVYEIELEYIELIRGVKMPPVRNVFNLTIDWFPPPPEPVEKVIIPEPKNLPRPQIFSFMMNGKMQIFFTSPMGYPEDLEKDLDIKIIPGEMTDPALLGFSFNVISTTESEINVKFNFDNPLDISQELQPERVNVTINMERLTRLDGEEMAGYASMTSFIPRQIPSEAEAAAIEDSGSSSEGASTVSMLLNFVVSLIMAASLNQLWSMLNGLQLAVHMPLFFTPFPANANFFITFIITVATFDILPEKVLPLIFDFPVKPGYNLAFEACGYGSMYPVMNLGTCFFLFNIYLMQVCIWAVSYFLKDRFAYFQRCFDKYDKVLFWGSLIRLLFEGYLELCLSVLIGLTDIEWTGENYNGSVLYCNIFSIILSIMLLALPFFIYIFYTVNMDEMDDEDFVERYGDIYDGLVLSTDKDKRQAAVFYPFWFCMRRLIFALVAIFFPEQLGFQLATAFICALINLCYLIAYKPFAEDKISNLEIMNEGTCLILLYHVCLFSGFVTETETRYLIGWSFIFFTCSNMAVHFGLLVKATYIEMKESLTAKYCPKRVTTEEDLKKDLSIIAEESMESNNSSEDDAKKKESPKITESDWDSQDKGCSEKGFKMAAIKWTDLGRKFEVKRGQKSNMPDLEFSEDYGKRCNTAGGERDENAKLRKCVISDADRTMINSLSQLRLKPMPRRFSLAIDTLPQVDQVTNDLASSNAHMQSQQVIYQVCSSRIGQRRDNVLDDDDKDDNIDSDRSMPADDTQRNLMFIDTCMRRDRNENRVAPEDNYRAQNIPLGKVYNDQQKFVLNQRDSESDEAKEEGAVRVRADIQ